VAQWKFVESDDAGYDTLQGLIDLAKSNGQEDMSKVDVLVLKGGYIEISWPISD
jgi:hypothetical protein